jgi:hypothetical protein
MGGAEGEFCNNEDDDGRGTDGALISARTQMQAYARRLHRRQVSYAGDVGAWLGLESIAGNGSAPLHRSREELPLLVPEDGELLPKLRRDDKGHINAGTSLNEEIKARPLQEKTITSNLIPALTLLQTEYALKVSKFAGRWYVGNQKLHRREYCFNKNIRFRT